MLTAWARPFGSFKHDDAASQGGPPEHDPRHLGPASSADVFRRIVAEHQHVQVVDRDSLRSGPRAAEFVQVGRQDLVFVFRRRTGPRSDVVVRVERQIARADQPGFVSAIDGRHRQPRGRIVGQFRLDGVNDKTDFHVRLPVRQAFQPDFLPVGQPGKADVPLRIQ